MPAVQQPVATVTVTGTVKVVQDPDPVPLEDQLQGWGTLGAIAAALLVAVIGWIVEGKRRKRDNKAGDKERKEDREDADRRLHEERAAADTRLQKQLDEQRDRDRRAFLIAQIQGAGDLYAEQKGMQRDWMETRLLTSPDDPGRRYAERVAVQRLRAYLPAIPPPYASLMKVQVFGSHSPLVNELTLHEARRRAPSDVADDVGPIDTEAIYRELADNIAELLSAPEPESDAEG
jgi:hypothetical protein